MVKNANEVILFIVTGTDLWKRSDADPLTTDKRLADFLDHKDADKNLAPLLFQYGRYLSISSTRVGLLPANLQVVQGHLCELCGPFCSL